VGYVTLRLKFPFRLIAFLACSAAVVAKAQGMTQVYKSGLRACPETARAGGRVAARDAAPALFRLLSDSALYRAAFAACRVPLAIVEASASGKTIASVNPAFERRFGLAETEVSGRPFATALCRGDLDAESALFSEEASCAQVKLWRKDGTSIEMDASVGAVRDESGRQTHWVVAFAEDGPAEPPRAVSASHAQSSPGL
jgi:PAS domain S-box-containing protein